MRRARVLPALVIDPRDTLAPVDRSLGTRPSQAMNWRGLLKRLKSPISDTKVTAEICATPRRAWMLRRQDCLLGTFIGDKRERIVLATKFTMAREPGNPNSGGNHRLNMVRSVEQSLKQLGTDRIDLLYLHAWDMTTRPDEVTRALDDLVRAGKVLYLGICNTPAWRVTQMQTLADIRGWSPFVALQIEYSLVERTVEHEPPPAAAALGLGGSPVVTARRWRTHR